MSTQWMQGLPGAPPALVEALSNYRREIERVDLRDALDSIGIMLPQAATDGSREQRIASAAWSVVRVHEELTASALGRAKAMVIEQRDRALAAERLLASRTEELADARIIARRLADVALIPQPAEDLDASSGATTKDVR